MRFIQRIQVFRLSLIAGMPLAGLSLRKNIHYILQDWRMAKQGKVRILERGVSGQAYMGILAFMSTTATQGSPQERATQRIKGRAKLTVKPSRVYRAKEGKWHDVKDVWEGRK